MEYKLKRDDLVLPDLSFQINGLLFDVYKQLGPGLLEKNYQKAVAIALQKAGLNFKEQVHVPLKYDGKTVGCKYLDFLVEEKLIIELKQGAYISPSDIKQIYDYLVINNLQLGLLACFTPNGVTIRRILNIIR